MHFENGTTSLGKVMKHRNIPLTSMSNHLNGKTHNRKCEPTSVLTNEEDHDVVTWTLAMQEVKISTILQQLKMIMTKIIQTKLTPF